MRFLVRLIQDKITKANANMYDSVPANIFCFEYTQIKVQQKLFPFIHVLAHMVE